MTDGKLKQEWIELYDNCTHGAMSRLDLAWGRTVDFLKRHLTQ